MNQAPASAINKWIVAITVVFGTFVAVMDISVVNVALPHMMGSFAESQSAITWVATAYSIAEIILATMAGWFSTLLGRKRLYLLSYGVFTIGSALAGMAPSFTWMIIFRVIQGMGGGALIPVSQAILRENFPDEQQGTAMAMYGMGVVLAPAVGPVLGGWLTDHYGWPWIFYINIPVCLLGMFLVGLFVHDPHYLRRGIRKVDWWGIALLTVCLTCMQVVLERGQESDWLNSNWIIIGIVATVAAGALLVWWELHTSEPVVDFRLLKNLPLTAGTVIGGVFGIALFGTTFVIPQLTQELFGYTAYQAGLVLAPRAVVLFMFMPIAGWLYKYVNARLLILGGIVLIFWSLRDLGQLNLEVGFWNIVPALVLMGVGMPFMFVTMSTVALSTVPRPKMTEATSIYTLARRIGGNVGYALVATVVARSTQIHFHDLGQHVSVLNPIYVYFHQHASQVLAGRGVPGNMTDQATMALAGRQVTRQATMMAYNDTSQLVAWLLLVTVPLLLVIPSRKKMVRQGQPLPIEAPEA
jgi:MFS transporter, DHA2 family, multidrug resistance protein